MLVAVGLGAFAVFAVFGLALRGESTRAIVQRAPCLSEPAGVACQESKRVSDRKRSIADSCIAFRKVDHAGRLLRLTRCVERSSRPRSLNTDAVRSAEPSGDASQPAPVADQPSEPGVRPGGGGGGTDRRTDQPSRPNAPSVPDQSSPATPTPASAAPAEPPASVSTPPAAPPASTPPSDPGKPTIEEVGEMVQETGNSLGPVTCAATSLLHPCP